MSKSKGEMAVGLVCEVCQEPAKRTSKILVCSKCARGYHATCMILNKEKICSICLVTARPANMRKSLGASGTSTGHARPGNLFTGKTPDRRSSGIPAPTGPKTRNSRSNSSNASCSDESLNLTDDRFKMLMDRFDILDGKFNKLSGQMNKKIDRNTDDIVQMRNEQRLILERLEALEDEKQEEDVNEDQGTRGDGPRSGLSRAAATQVSTIAARQQSLSSALVVGGLPVNGDEVNLRLAAYAAFRAVDSGLEEREVLCARFIGRPRDHASPVARETGEAAAATDANDQSHVRASRPRPIFVNLHSSAVAAEVIKAKIRKRKVTTSEIDAGLLHTAGVNTPLPLLNINVNAYLPPEAYKLYVIARSKAMKASKEDGFQVFPRGGQVYVRWKKGDKSDKPMVISSTEDLDFFLDSRKR